MEDFLAGGNQQIDFIFFDDLFQRDDKRIPILTRSWDDIAAELQFAAENVDPDTEFHFIRP